MVTRRSGGLIGTQTLATSGSSWGSTGLPFPARGRQVRDNCHGAYVGARDCSGPYQPVRLLSQIFTVLSWCAVASRMPSGLKRIAEQEIGPADGGWEQFLPVRRIPDLRRLVVAGGRQPFAVRAETDAPDRPVCPRRVSSSCPLAASQIFAVSSPRSPAACRPG